MPLEWYSPLNGNRPSKYARLSRCGRFSIAKTYIGDEAGYLLYRLPRKVPSDLIDVFKRFEDAARAAQEIADAENEGRESHNEPPGEAH